MNKKISKLRVAMILDKRRELKSGNYPVRTRVTIGKAQYYFVTNIESTEELFERANEPKPQKEAKKLRDEMDSIKSYADTVCKNLPSFTPEAFKKAFYKDATAPTTPNGIFDTFKSVIDELESKGKIGNANLYKTSMRSIAAFVDDKLKEHNTSNRSGKKRIETKLPKLKFEQITVKWLEDYQQALTALKVSPSTQGIYLRILRRIINIERKKNPTLSYPFGKDDYTPPTATKHKRALTIEEVRTLRNYEPQTEPEQRAKDLWLFSYLCNGMNVADIIKLQHKEVRFHSKGCTIEFLRQKTQHKNDKSKILIELDNEPAELIKSIIDTHGNQSKQDYLFPYLNDKNTPQAQYTAKLSLLRLLNKSLRKIGKKLNFELDLTTYVARHSFATIMQRSGVSTAEISEALGHAELKTTSNYLDGFSEESKRNNSKKLL